MSDSDRICVGAVGGAFGVRGEVRLKSFTAMPEDIAAYSPLSTEDGTRAFDVTLTGQTTNGFTAQLSGVTTKEAADALRGTRLYALRAQLPNLPDDEFYHADLIGLELAARAGYLAAAYADLVADRDQMDQRLDQLVPLQGYERIDAWRAMAQDGAFVELAEALMAHHYDPRYEKSRARYAHESLAQIDLLDMSETARSAAAARIVARLNAL